MPRLWRIMFSRRKLNFLNVSSTWKRVVWLKKLYRSILFSKGEKEIFLIFNNSVKKIYLLFLLYIVPLFFIHFYYSHTLVLPVHNFLLISSIHFRLFPCDRIIIWIYSCDENYGKRVIKFVIIILLIHRKNILLSYILLNSIRNFDFYWLQ